MTEAMGGDEPLVIQGGMGIGVSGWRLARAVALSGQLGVVSGVGLDSLLARRLQLGDEGGHLRRALSRFPLRRVGDAILERYFVEGGIGEAAPFRLVPRLSLHPSPEATELTIAANFVEVHLAKEGHDGLVGVNFLEKLQMATPAAAYGAMLAGVDYVLVGAGIPAELPRLLDALAAGEAGEVSVDVVDPPGGPGQALVRQEPLPGAPARLRRPRFLAIVSSHALAAFLARDERTRPDGFVVEGHEAGGHSAPPRGPLALDEDGQPRYGPRDAPALDRVAALGLPFWLAGGRAGPDRLAQARRAGAAGIQVGSAFALCEESGLAPPLKQALIAAARSGTLRVRNDPTASPTGFPFKLARLAGTLADGAVSERRRRVCDVGYLRTPVRDTDGQVRYRCPAEPVAAYVRKGGTETASEGRSCLCNGLIAAIGLGQRRRRDGTEPALVTIGQDLSFLPELLEAGQDTYRAADVVAHLLAGRDPDLPPGPLR